MDKRIKDQYIPEHNGYSAFMCPGGLSELEDSGLILEEDVRNTFLSTATINPGKCSNKHMPVLHFVKHNLFDL